MLVTPDERAAWRGAAAELGVTLSEWIRRRCATSSESDGFSQERYKASEPLLRVVRAAKDGRASELCDALAALKDET